MTGNDIRRLIIRHAYMAGESHIGSALCIADILAVLYTDVMKDGDKFVLSKGHAALALYAALFLKGVLTQEDMDGYCTEGGQLGVHPDHQTPGVEFSTGSLGQGITYAVGQALALKRSSSSARVYCLVSDAECQEGSVWESVALAVRLRLGNLTIIVDSNGMGAMGEIDDELIHKFVGFGCVVNERNGHNYELGELFKRSAYSYQLHGRPQCVMALTVAGKGVSFMEGTLKWHYAVMNEQEYAQALKELV